ncbi:hypothetical protein PP707_06930 [Acetobacter pasteurianus]|nr:hypothetical protein [Acetobacter pasteurianus]
MDPGGGLLLVNLLNVSHNLRINYAPSNKSEQNNNNNNNNNNNHHQQNN